MASGRINRNVLIYISGGSGCTPSEANTLVPTPVLTTAWVRGLTSDSILTADRRGGILIHEHEASVASHSKRVTQATMLVALGCRSENAARRDLRITSDGRGAYKWTVSSPACSGTTQDMCRILTREIATLSNPIQPSFHPGKILSTWLSTMRNPHEIGLRWLMKVLRFTTRTTTRYNSFELL